MLEEAIKRFDLVAVAVLTWVLAIGLGWLAVQQLTAVGDLKAVVSAARALQPKPLQLERQPISAAEITRIANAIRPYIAPGLKLEATPTQLVLTGDRIDLQPALTVALSEIMAAAPELHWVVDSMCIGGDCKPAMSVKVRAYQNQVRQKGR